MIDGGAVTGGGGADEQTFLRVLCHELGTPVASVQALAHALAHRRTSLSHDQRAEALRLIEGHAQHLATMLDAVRAVADHLPRSTAAPSAAELTDLVRGAAHAAGLEGLQTRIAPVVRVVTIDVPALRRILTNLLQNAHQHGAGPVDLVAERRAGDLLIVVTDRGDGMPDHLRATAFRPDAPAGGGQHGLGLWIVTQLVTMLGGSARADAGRPTGTRIEVVLPLRR